MRTIAPQKVQAQFLSSPADIAVYGGAGGSGKLLDLDTELPSPSGWLRLGDVVDGDVLFDETGTVCTVVKAHDIEIPERAYRLIFDDGSSVVAGGEHLWKTLDSKDREALTRRDSEWKARRRARRPSRVGGLKSERFSKSIQSRNSIKAAASSDQNLPLPTGSIKTTDELAATLLDARGGRNHAIAVCGGWRLPEADLPLDPYLFGVWLGDGTAISGSVTTADDEIVSAFVEAGFKVVKYKNRYLWGVNGLQTLLRRIGVLGDKQIPLIYRRASFEQRLALLQGLMDTDGYAKPKSSAVEFYSIRATLAEQVFELAISLGCKATLRSKTARLNGRDCGLVYTVAFSTDLPVFRLKRKLEKRKPSRRSVKFRYLVSCERVDPVPMRCLTVDSPSHLYCCGRSAIPTHNTMALLLEPLRHIRNPRFSAIIFRRESKQIFLPGGLFDQAMTIYPGLGSEHRQQPMLEFKFRSGAKIVMTHLNQESDTAAFQGSELPLICYDELTHFSRSQFFYLLSRNRSNCGINPYIRGTCNPDPDSWVADFIGWWIDQDTGYPIPERSGQLRYFITVPTENDTMQVWGNSPEETALKVMGLNEDMALRLPSPEERAVADRTIDRFIELGMDVPPEEMTPLLRFEQYVRSAKSVTFIPAKVHDNPALLRANPEYLANLKALDRVQQGRLLHGNWKIRPMAGMYFARVDARFIDEVPDDVVRWVRSWDLAATEPGEKNRDPDWTVGMKLGRRRNGRVVVAEVIRIRLKAAAVRALVLETARRDGRECWIQIPQDPGQAGKDQIDSYFSLLAGFALFSRSITRNKVAMAEPAAAAWQRGSIELVKADWNDPVLAELDQFPDSGAHDDCADALSGGYKLLPSASHPDYSQSGLSRKFRELLP